jgi:hypothetical protein
LKEGFIVTETPRLSLFPQINVSTLL